MASKLEPNALDRVLLAIAPKWALTRVRARAAALTLQRHFEAASPGRRTAGWPRHSTDANMANHGALGILREHARELIRNNGWAQNGQRVIERNTVGWGLIAKAKASPKAQELWKKWSGADENHLTECDADGMSTFAAMQALIIKAIAADGEVLIRRRWRRASDGLTLPLQLQVLEADFLDITKGGFVGLSGGPTIQGVEFDLLGRRRAYWLFEEHPGSGGLVVSPRSSLLSKRVRAEDVLHVFRSERPGQVRGVSWYSAAIVKLKDFDEYDDATLMRQKIAACFAAFVTDTEGLTSPHLGAEVEGDAADLLEGLEPGMLEYLPPGKSITFANPPGVNDHGSYTAINLRQVAASIGTTYEDLSGDFSQVNFSSARMSRIAFYGNVHAWRWRVLVPLFCAPVWRWAMEAAQVAGELPAGDAPGATWTPPPMPMIEPDKEGLALARLVRTGAMTPSEMVREQGFDPDDHWEEYAADLKKLDEKGIILDSDARKVSQAGLTQERNFSKGGGGAPPPPAGDDAAKEPDA
jgi:lambda family phage portal protein